MLYFTGNHRTTSAVMAAKARPSGVRQPVGPSSLLGTGFFNQDSFVLFGAGKPAEKKEPPAPKPRPGEQISDDDPRYLRELAAYRRARRDPEANFRPEDKATIKDRIAGRKSQDRY